MKLRTYIVEDSARSQQTLQQMLTTYCPKVEVIGLASSVEQALQGIPTARPDLVMLDIELTPGNAFTLLEKLPSLDFEIIFTTAHDQYALKAIKFSAIDYLLKPINIQELIQAVSRAEEQRQRQQAQQRYDSLFNNLGNPRQKLTTLAVPIAEGFEVVQVSDIVRLEGEEGYTLLVLAPNRHLITTRRLKEWEAILEDQDFFRIHRSHLINFHHLKRYHRANGGYVEMADGAELDVSRRRRDAFVQCLSHWK